MRQRSGRRPSVRQGLCGLSRLTAGVLLAPVLTCAAQSSTVQDLSELSLEQLGDIQITSVSKRAESVSDAPASIFVITAENIRRSGVTSLHEALRLAPNLQVARVNASQYAISARGFNNAVGNKLLVLIDGRTVYTPLFSGVFWEQQDLVLEDVERIEVISGPGAALWGANAVNGVVNIITRPAGQTQGALASLGTGSEEDSLSFRYGGTLGDIGHYRAYAKRFDASNTEGVTHAELRDQFEREQAGFRADLEGAAGSFTVQGDAYRGETEDRGLAGPILVPPITVDGLNLLARWTRQFANGSELRVQAYYDHYSRDDLVLFRAESDVFDVEFQHGVTWGAHKVLWGGGYRHASDDTEPAVFTSFVPSSRDLEWYNAFVQDEYAFTDGLRLTAGIKLAHNDFTGLEYLPSIRLAWKPSENHLLWSAASRAVRVPARFDRDVFFPNVPPFVVAGGPEFESEVAEVVEIGYRAQPSSVLNYSVTAFYHRWEHLRSGRPLPLPITLVNNIRGKAFGVEAWGNWQVMSPWLLSGGVTVVRKSLEFRPGTTDTVGTRNDTLHNDPEFQWMLRSSFDLPTDVELDFTVRRVGALPHPPVPDYTAVDVRLGWAPVRGIELSVVGQNIFDQHHGEFGAAATRSLFERSVFLKMVWTH